MSEEWKKSFMTDPVGKTMQGLVAALIVWLYVSVHELSVTVAVQTASINNMGEKFAVLSLDRYTGTQAKADQALFLQRLAFFEGRLETLRERVGALEQEIAKGGKE